MEKHSACPTRYEIYIPNNLQKHPEIVLISRNPHSHPNPSPIKTPESLKKVLVSLIEDTGWRLADMTPRKLSLDTGFMSSLRKILNWDNIQDPSLSKLHPSLGNLDHRARIIDSLREIHFPAGTGLLGKSICTVVSFEGSILSLILGAFSLYQQQLELLKEEQYVRHVETINIPNHKPFTIVICMLPAMSQLLVKTKYPTIDTSFKRAAGYQEFELEAWFPSPMKCKPFCYLI